MKRQEKPREMAVGKRQVLLPSSRYARDLHGLAHNGVSLVMRNGLSC